MNSTIEKLYDHFKLNPVVSTDTRKISPGCIFFALKGDSFNGNTFASKALELGAALVVIDEPEFDKGKGYFLVEDVLTALQQLALFHRRTFTFPFIAITGSNGKTTTKELTGAVLSGKYKVCATQGNLNNHIGVPLTLLQVNEKHQMAIIEMGANHQLEIAFLCELAEPTHGLITNIGKAHLEGFGGLEGVKKGKGELFSFLKLHNQTIFINTDQPALLELLGDYKNFVSYGIKHDAYISGNDVSVNNFLSVNWKNKEENTENNISTKLTGNYNLANVLAAVCLGNYFKISADIINQKIADYNPDNQRSQVIKKGNNTIILDAYNANPTSMEAALKNFTKNYTGKKMAVLGDMLELGKESMMEHGNILSQLETMPLDIILLVGENFNAYKGKSKAHFFMHADEAKTWIENLKPENFSVLIKGSRGLKMEITLTGF